MTNFYLNIFLLAIMALFGGNLVGGEFPDDSASGWGPHMPASSFADSEQVNYLTGKVMLNDGSAPFTMVPIELGCHGESRVETYSDPKGNFMIDFTPGRRLFGSASGGMPAIMGFTHGASPGLRERDTLDCELHASLPGFRSDSISLAGQALGRSDLGTIILHPLGNVAGFTISATSALAPKPARAAYERGMDHIHKKQIAQAEKELTKAVGLYPRYAVAWFELGQIREGRNHPEEARDAFSHALAADSKYISPYVHLCILAINEKKWEEAGAAATRVVSLNPFDFPGAYYFQALAELNLNKLDAAEKSAREAIRLDTARHYPKANYVLGLTLAREGNYAEAVEWLKMFLTLMPTGPGIDVVRQQLASVEKLAAH